MSSSKMARCYILYVLILFLARGISVAHAKVTVLAYMMGDNDRACGMLNNLKQLSDAYATVTDLSAPTSPELYIQIDGGPPACLNASNQQTPPLPGLPTKWTTAKRLTLLPGGIFQVDTDLGEINSASAHHLQAFLESALAKYPPAPDRQHFLILSHHGSGFRVLGSDSACSPKDTPGARPCAVLGAKDALGAIKAALASANLSRLSMIGLDASLSSTWEALAGLAAAADYILASETLAVAHGWDWGTLGGLAASPQMGMPELGSSIIRGYISRCQKAGSAGCSLALHSTAALPALSKALAAVAVAVTAAVDADATGAVTGAILEARQAAFDADMHWGKDLVDISRLMQQLAKTIPAAAQVQAAVEAMQLDFAAYQTPQEITGVSMYWPRITTTEQPEDLLSEVKDSKEAAALNVPPKNWIPPPPPDPASYPKPQMPDQSYLDYSSVVPELQPVAEMLSKLNEAMSNIAPSPPSASSKRAPAAAAAPKPVLPALALGPAYAVTVTRGGGVPVSRVTADVTSGRVLAAEQLLGFMDPMGTGLFVVADVKEPATQPSTTNASSTVTATFAATLAALTQRLDSETSARVALFAAQDVASSSSSSSSGVQLVTMHANVIYASSCNDPIESMQLASLDISYDASKQATRLALTTGASETPPAAGGVIIPVTFEIDPRTPNETYFNWDASACLKWGYADDIKLVMGPANQFDYPGAPNGLGPAMAGGIRAAGYSRTNVQLQTAVLGRVSTQITSSGCLCSREYNNGTCTVVAAAVGTTVANMSAAAAAAGTQCAVEQGSCSSSRAAAAPPATDSCAAVTTLAGCRCRTIWSSGFGGSQTGSCQEPNVGKPLGTWCQVDTASCKAAPAGQDDVAIWDYCTAPTTRGCRCANPWIDPATGVTYNGTCAPGNATAPPVCIVDPDSCAVEGPLSGGDVWDTCRTAAAPPAATPAESTNAAAGPSSQCVVELLTACKSAGLNIDRQGQVVFDIASAACDIGCYAAACTARTPGGGCGDVPMVVRIVHNVFRAMDAACAGLAPSQFHCHWVVNPVPDNDNCPRVPKQLSDVTSGTIASAASYQPYSSCGWEITNQLQPFITLTPESFDTEAGYDYVYVSDTSGLIGYYSGKEAASNVIKTDTGYLLVEFYSDESIGGAGFKLSYSAAADPAPLECPAGQRAITFFVRTGQADVTDIGWAVLAAAADMKTADGTAVLAAGGYMPDVARFSNVVSAAVLTAAEALTNGLQSYRTWSVAAELRCLAAGKYVLAMMATNRSSWDGYSSVTIAVPEKQLLAAQMQQGQLLTSFAFEVPAAADASAAKSPAKLPAQGTFGFSADVVLNGNYSAEDMRGGALGMVKTAVARAVVAVTQNIVVTNVKNFSANSAGRRLLGNARADGETDDAASASAAATARIAARGKRAGELARARIKAMAAAVTGKPGINKTKRSGQGRAAAAQQNVTAVKPHRASLFHDKARAAADTTRRRLLQIQPGAVVTVKIIGFSDAGAATSASTALADAAKSGKLAAYLSEQGFSELSGASIENAKVLSNADASAGRTNNAPAAIAGSRTVNAASMSGSPVSEVLLLLLLLLAAVLLLQ